MSTNNKVGRYGPIAAVPLLGTNSGSAQASTDPFSPQSLAAAAMKQQVQATADTRYDPEVPAPIVREAFETKHLYKYRAIGTALLLLALVQIHLCLK